jgi:hypothetical protein
MGFLNNICRNLGLMVHNIQHPDAPPTRQIVKKETHEEKRGQMTLRRTIIEEIELRHDKPTLPPDSK